MFIIPVTPLSPAQSVMFVILMAPLSSPQSVAFVTLMIPFSSPQSVVSVTLMTSLSSLQGMDMDNFPPVLSLGFSSPTVDHEEPLAFGTLLACLNMALSNLAPVSFGLVI